MVLGSGDRELRLDPITNTDTAPNAISAEVFLLIEKSDKKLYQFIKQLLFHVEVPPIGFWQPVLCEVNDAHNYLQTEGLNIHQWAKKIRALQTVLEVKRDEFVDDALMGSKVLPVWLGSSRTGLPGVSPPPPLYNILPMQILTSSFHHFTETVQGFDKIPYFHQGNDLEVKTPSTDYLP
ncbi:uncharacterized protein TNCV_4153731 [Trichonephila clavipes]|nr:uncharacterized protein TNCV_4153731 [Trichonephila clavipes]